MRIDEATGLAAVTCAAVVVGLMMLCGCPAKIVDEFFATPDRIYNARPARTIEFNYSDQWKVYIGNRPKPVGRIEIDVAAGTFTCKEMQDYIWDMDLGGEDAN